MKYKFHRKWLYEVFLSWGTKSKQDIVLKYDTKAQIPGSAGWTKMRFKKSVDI
jgi:hypothetical protein